MAEPEARHEGYKDALNLTISLCLTYTLCIAGVRVWIRKGAFGVDDVVIAVATVVTLCHTACDYASLAYGLGLPWSAVNGEAELQRLNESSIAGVILFIVALYLSKCAMLAFLGRITKSSQQVLLYHTCNAVVAVLGLVSVLVATVDCPAESGFYWAFYDNQPSCPDQSQRWQAITALDLVTEILLLALPVQLIWGLHMSTMKKVMLIAAFSLRLPTIAFSVVRNYYTLQLTHSSTDPGLHAAIVVIWLEVQLAYALAASTLSALKAFTETFNSGFGQGFTRGRSDTSSYHLTETSGSHSSKTEKPSMIEHSRSLSPQRSTTSKGITDKAIDLVAYPRASQHPAMRGWTSLSDDEYASPPSAMRAGRSSLSHSYATDEKRSLPSEEMEIQPKEGVMVNLS